MLWRARFSVWLWSFRVFSSKFIIKIRIPNRFYSIPSRTLNKVCYWRGIESPSQNCIRRKITRSTSFRSTQKLAWHVSTHRFMEIKTLCKDSICLGTHLLRLDEHSSYPRRWGFCWILWQKQNQLLGRYVQ